MARRGRGAKRRAQRPTLAKPAAERPLPAPLGTLLRERFELAEVIGRGGMSTVYRAIDHRRRQARAAEPDVALKIIDIDEGYRDDAAILLHREGRRLMALRHPNIVHVHDFDRDGSLFFLVMELLRGKTLAKAMLERGGLALDRSLALRVVDAVGAGLAAVHDADLVHGDIKPGNVFITRDGGVRLIDFGTAHAALPPDHAPGEDETVFFVQRMRAVTLAYASPAVLAGQPAGPSDDIFSFAVMAYVVLAGRHPFDGQSAAAALAGGLTPERPAGLSGARWQALRAGLSMDPAVRPASAAACAGRIVRPGFADHRAAWTEAAITWFGRFRPWALRRRKPVNARS